MKASLLSIGLLVVTVFCTVVRGEDSPKRPPNFVFFVADDMQREMFNCLAEGEEPFLTPNLDRLAAEGTLMTQQYVSSPVCTPSRFTCLTGRFASRSTSRALLETIVEEGQSVVNWNTRIRPGQPSLPTLLQRAGYKTGMVGKNHVFEVPGRRKVGRNEDPRDPLVHARLQADQQTVCNAIRRCGFDYAAAIYQNNPESNGPKALAVHNLDWIAQAAIRFVEENQDHPFFLYFASTVPHAPCDPAQSWNADRCTTPAGFLDGPPNVLPSREEIPKRLEDAGVSVDNQRANMLWLDDALGVLLWQLQELGLDDNTIVFFFNDNGQGAKGALYQDGIRSPSIIWRKGGFPCKLVCNVKVSNTDFAPTILDFAGIRKPDDLFDGSSFRPALEGSAEPIHEALYFELGYARAVVVGRWKYLALRYPERARTMSWDERVRILNEHNASLRERGRPILTTDPSARFSHLSLIPGGGDAEAASTGQRPAYYDSDQLYDLQRDPLERKNLAGNPDYADVLAEMKQHLQDYLRTLPGGFADLKN